MPLSQSEDKLNKTKEANVVPTYTLKETYKRTHYIFILVQKVKLCHTKLLFYKLMQGFAETLQVISFQNVSFVLHRLNTSKGTLISKINTFHINIKYSTETLPVEMFDCLKVLLNAMI